MGSLLLVEADLLGTSGLSLVRQLREEHFNSPIIVMTNIATAGMHQRAIKFGATELIEKPFVRKLFIKRIIQLLSCED